MIFFLFISGLVFGSFINYLVYRLNNGVSLSGRSICPKCKAKISWFDNIPLLSFLLLKGKCRRCHSSISFFYPLVELTTALVFLSVFFLSEKTNFYFLNLSFNLAFSVVLLTIFFSDIEYQTIPDQMIVAGVILILFNWFAGYFLFDLNLLLLLNNIIAGILGMLFFLFLHFLTKGQGMGMGDVKLVFLLGILLGLRGLLVALFLAFLTGALIGVILILVNKSKLKDKIAFGPFLVFACFVSLFFSKTLCELWIKMVLQ